MTRTLRNIVFAGLLVLSLVAGVASFPVSAQENPVTTIDKDHELDCSEDVAKDSFSAPNMEIRIGSDSDQVGLDGFNIDAGGKYIKLDYQEERSRTVRLHIPEECFTPYEDTLEPIKGNAQGELKVIEDASYTSLTVDFTEGEETVVFKTSSAKGFGFSAWERIKNPFSEDTGIPAVDDETEDDTDSKDTESVEQWKYIDAEKIASDDSYKIETSRDDSIVQYNAASGDEEETADWQRIPTSSDADAPLFLHTREDVQDAVWVMQTGEETTQVRYKTETKGDIFSEVSSGVNDIVDGIKEDLSGIDLIPFI